MKLDVSSLAHMKWECKYRMVFAPKYRRKVIYGKIKQDIGQMLRKLCEYKGIEIIEAEACGPYTYAGKYPAEIQCIANNGIHEGKEQFDDI